MALQTRWHSLSSIAADMLAIGKIEVVMLFGPPNRRWDQCGVVGSSDVDERGLSASTNGLMVADVYWGQLEFWDEADPLGERWRDDGDQISGRSSDVDGVFRLEVHRIRPTAWPGFDGSRQWAVGGWQVVTGFRSLGPLHKVGERKLRGEMTSGG